MRRVAKRRAPSLRRYLAESRKWLEDKSCVRCGVFTGLTVQHAAGRRGARLLDKRFWVALDWPCHSWAEHHPREAEECGLRLPRNVTEARLLEMAAQWPWFEVDAA